MSTTKFKNELNELKTLYSKEQYDQVIKGADRILLFDAQQFNALFYKAISLEKLNKNDDSKEIYLKITNKHPNQVLGWQVCIELILNNFNNNHQMFVLINILHTNHL